MSESGSVRIHKQHGNKHGLESIKTQLDQILASFSAQSLVHYKSISKFWYDLICSPEFVRLQQRCSREDMIYIICPYPRRGGGFRYVYLMDRHGDIINKFTLPCLNRRSSIHLISTYTGLLCFTNESEVRGSSIRLISSFNGLLCLTNESESIDIDICICNPITKKVLMLPKGSPSIATPTVGVAFDVDSGQYKVFRFSKDFPESEHFKCEVYSSGNESWKGIGNVECRPIHSCDYQANTGHICIGGRVYWFSRSKTNPSTPIGILSVDMKEEKFKRISFPQDVEVDELSCLIDFDGHLSLVTAEFMIDKFSLEWDRSKAYIDIWVLENSDQSKWCHKISTELEVDDIIGFNSVVAIKNEILFIVMDSDREVHLRVYDSDEDYWWMLEPPSKYRWDNPWKSPVVLPFAGSLYPCRGI